MNRDALNRELAAGATAAQSPELEMRAAQLVSGRERRRLAGSLRRAIRDARRPATLFDASLLRRGAVIDAEGAIDAAIARLTDAEPVAAEGMAMFERLFTDGGSSPFYNLAEPGTLRRQVMAAIDALDAERGELLAAA
jgi:hypothetical protein